MWDDGIRGEMPSQGSQQEWGSFGSIAGDGLGKEWREMGHSVQWTSVYLVDAARRCSAGNKWLQV